MATIDDKSLTNHPRLAMSDDIAKLAREILDITATDAIESVKEVEITSAIETYLSLTPPGSGEDAELDKFVAIRLARLAGCSGGEWQRFLLTAHSATQAMKEFTEALRDAPVGGG